MYKNEIQHSIFSNQKWLNQTKVCLFFAKSKSILLEMNYIGKPIGKNETKQKLVVGNHTKHNIITKKHTQWNLVSQRSQTPFILISRLLQYTREKESCITETESNEYTKRGALQWRKKCKVRLSLSLPSFASLIPLFFVYLMLSVLALMLWSVCVLGRLSDGSKWRMYGCCCLGFHWVFHC